MFKTIRKLRIPKTEKICTFVDGEAIETEIKRGDSLEMISLKIANSVNKVDGKWMAYADDNGQTNLIHREINQSFTMSFEKKWWKKILDKIIPGL